jgi:hypothetical protein
MRELTIRLSLREQAGGELSTSFWRCSSSWTDLCPTVVVHRNGNPWVVE